MSKSIQPSHWLLAEQVRHSEQAQGRLIDDASANAVAREEAPELGARIARRALALPGTQAVLGDFKQLKRLFVWCCVALGLIAVVAAFATVRLAIDQREIEILAVVATLLGLPTVLLLVWVITLAIWRQPSNNNLLTALSGAVFRRLGPFVLSGPRPEATLAAATGLLFTPPGRWLIGAVSHAFWLLYLLSALALITVFLIVSQYDLGWGTTLLSDADALALLALLAYVPDLLGLLPSPDSGWLEAGRLGVAPELVRAPWGRFLLVIIVVYGLLPRLIAFFLSLVMAWYGFGRLSLDVKQPGYLRLSALLMPPPATSRTDDLAQEPRPRDIRVAKEDAAGITTVSVEAGPRASEESLFGSDEALNLGAVETRADRERVLGALDGRQQPAAYFVVQSTARRTPDRGLVALINQLADAAGGVLIIALADTESLEDWGVDPQARLADWHRLAQQTGGQVQSLPSVRALVGLS